MGGKKYNFYFLAEEESISGVNKNRGGIKINNTKKIILVIAVTFILFSGCIYTYQAEPSTIINSDKKFKVAIFNSTITGAFTFPHKNITDALDSGSYYSNMFSHAGQVKALEEWMSAYGLPYDEINESQIEDGYLLAGTDPSYPILIVPYVSIASSLTESSLLNYMKHGGTVLNFGLLGKYDTNVKPMYYQNNNITGAVVQLNKRSAVAQTFKAKDTNISVISLSKISWFGNPPDLVVNLTGTKLISGLYVPDETNILLSRTIPKELISTGRQISIKTIALTPLIVEFDYSNLKVGEVYAIVINGNSTGAATSNDTYYVYTSPKGGSTWGKSYIDGEEFVYYADHTWRNSTFANGYLSNLVIGIFNGTLRRQPLLFSSNGLELNDNQTLLSAGMVVHPYYGYYLGPDGKDAIMNMTVVTLSDPLSNSFENQNRSILFRVHHMYNISGRYNTILSAVLRQATPKLMGFDSNKELPLLIESNYGKGRFIEVAIMKDFNSMNQRGYLFTIILRNGIKSSFRNLNMSLIYKSWYPIGFQTAFAGLRMDDDNFNNKTINVYFDNILRNSVYYGHRLYNYGAIQWSAKYGNTYNQTLLNMINNGSVIGMHYDTIHRGPDDIGTNAFDQNWTNYWNTIDSITGGNYSSNGYNYKNYIAPGFTSLRYANVQNLSDKKVRFSGDTALIPFPHRYISFFSYGGPADSDTNYNTIPLIEYPLSVYYNKTLRIQSLNWDIKTYDETNTSIKWNYDNGFLINFYTHGADLGSDRNVQTYYQVLANYSGIWFTDFDNMTIYINNRYNFSFEPSYSNNLITLSLSGTNIGLSNITILNSTQIFDNGTVYIYPTHSILSVNVSQFSQTKQMNASITPSSDSVIVTIITWNIKNDYRKVWTESSANPTIVTTHIIGDFPPNMDIQIKRDGVAYLSEKTNSTGYLTFVYSGGFSDHTFEASLT